RFLKKPLTQINVIHWSGGHHKPWKTEGIVYGEIWRRYATPRTSSVPSAPMA
ncbi:MAG: hypothetical protein HC922_08565, partial [Leptolyngbyaceae cyanobacterium SM2_3_12]|nr:hypothetical protein [Leptolyngbyaceae cyanobacterium SM2_3_12]